MIKKIIFLFFWLSLLTIIIVPLLISLHNSYQEWQTFSSNVEYSEGNMINETFQVLCNKFIINWELLRKLDSSGFSEFVHSPNGWRLNSTTMYGGFIIKHPTTYETINEDGIRSTINYEIPKPDSTLRIIVIGDSYVAGASVNNNETISSLLENFLKEKFPLKNIEVLNLGVNGYNTKLELNRLIEKGIKYEPNIVLIGIVSNDYEDAKAIFHLDRYLVKKLIENNISETKAWEIRLGIPVSKYLPFNKTIQESIIKPLKELKEISKIQNFNVLVFSYPLVEQIPEKTYLQIIKGNVTNLGFEFFYLPEEIGFKYNSPWIIHPKDWHPSVYANKLTAEFLGQELLPKIEKIAN